MSEPAERGLRGHLDLTCALDSRGQSCLRRQSFSAPFHLSKPYSESGLLVVNLVNPTAGLLAGDRIESRVEVAAGARLLLTTPGANRAHRMLAGTAEVTQRFRVAAGGWLDFWPELFIPQAGTRYRQRTELEAEPGGELLFLENLAPGRVASGEAFAYESLHFSTDVSVAGKLVARERYRLGRDSRALIPLRAQFPTAYYAGAFLLTDRLPGDHPCWRRLEALQSPALRIGCSALAAHGWTIKLVAADSLALRQALSQMRTEVYAALGWPLPSVRRTVPLG